MCEQPDNLHTLHEYTSVYVNGSFCKLLAVHHTPSIIIIIRRRYAALHLLTFSFRLIQNTNKTCYPVSAAAGRSSTSLLNLLFSSIHYTLTPEIFIVYTVVSNFYKFFHFLLLTNAFVFLLLFLLLLLLLLHYC